MKIANIEKSSSNMARKYRKLMTNRKSNENQNGENNGGSINENGGNESEII